MAIKKSLACAGFFRKCTKHFAANHAKGVDIIKMLFATAKSYLTSSLFTITFYFPKTFSDGFSEK